MGFPFVRQHDSMQCGIACISMVSNYYGKRIPLDSLETHCNPSKEGVSFKALADLCEVLKLDCQAGRVSLENLVECPLPCILHWNQNHFVVLYKISKDSNKFYIADPAKGKYTVNRKQFLSHWLGVKEGAPAKGLAMFFEPTSEFCEEIATENRKTETFSFLSKQFLRFRQHFVQIFTGLLLAAVLQLAMPFLTQWIVDFGIKRDDIKFIWLLLLGEVMIVLGKTLTDFIRRWVLMHISVRINVKLLSDFFIKLLKLPMSFFETKLLGDLLQRMGDHTRIQTFMTSQIMSMVFSLMSFIVFGVVLLIYNALIFSIFILGSGAYTLWVVAFLRKRKVLDYRLFEQQAICQNTTYQFIANIPEIKLQGCENRRRWEWEDTQADLFELQLQAQRLQQTQEAGAIFINEIKNVVITVFAATAVINGQLSLGAMLAVQYIVGQLNSPVDQFMQFIYSLQDVRISLERINEIHRAKNEITGDNLLCNLNGSRDIVLNDVSFSYDVHSLKKTIDNVTLKIPQGKLTAIVGSSGSGKTTLIKLMLGFYRIGSGTIEISGEDIKDYNLGWWRKQCGVVMQEGVIFSESIARNIAVDDGEIDHDRMTEAAKIANIHDYVMSMPMKYATKIGRDGVGLSQGQKQRILIARAVYKNPDFIFLDEATNALDAHNERAIVENLNRFYRGKTVVVVAHRLSTVRNADQIIVLEKGRIVESGTHDSLTAAKGAYYTLVKNQLELGN